MGKVSIIIISWIFFPLVAQLPPHMNPYLNNFNRHLFQATAERGKRIPLVALTTDAIELSCPRTSTQSPMKGVEGEQSAPIQPHSLLPLSSL